MICDCPCHHYRGMMHIGPCCYPCQICHQNIVRRYHEKHEAECRAKLRAVVDAPTVIDSPSGPAEAIP